MNYAIFRSETIMTTHDLAQIGSHNQREKKDKEVIHKCLINQEFV